MQAFTTISSSYSSIPLQGFLSWMLLRWLVSHLTSNGRAAADRLQRQCDDVTSAGKSCSPFRSSPSSAGPGSPPPGCDGSAATSSGTRREIVFNGQRAGVFWRTLVFVFGCVFLIPIPWMMRWYSQLVRFAVRAGRKNGVSRAPARHLRSRTEPSCATEATSVPSGLKIMPRVKPRPPCALGEVLHVKQPFVGAERPVKPHRVIEACRHHALVEQRAAVARHHRIEQRKIRRIGQRAHMQRRIVGQFRGGADPDMDAAFVDLLAEITAELDRAQLRSGGRIRSSGG